MPLNLPPPLRRALRSGDLIACRHLLHAPHLESEAKLVVQADIERQAGVLGEATRIISSDQLETATAQVRIVAERIRGELLGSTGKVAEALDVLDRVVVQGEATREHEQAALAALSRFTLLASHRSLADSQQGLESAKRAVLRCGDAQLFAALHARVGQALAQRGLPSLAVNELQSALSV
jgi:hypothetical protein